MGDARRAHDIAVRNGARSAQEPTVLTSPSGEDQTVSEIELYGDVVLRFVSGSFQVCAACLGSSLQTESSRQQEECDCPCQPLCWCGRLCHGDPNAWALKSSSGGGRAGVPHSGEESVHIEQMGVEHQHAAKGSPWSCLEGLSAAAKAGAMLCQQPHVGLCASMQAATGKTADGHACSVFVAGSQLQAMQLCHRTQNSIQPTELGARSRLQQSVQVRQLSGLQGPYLATYQPVEDTHQQSYGLQRLDHAVGNAPKMLPVLDYIANATGFHEFAEFTAEDVGTLDSGKLPCVRVFLLALCTARFCRAG